MKKYEHSSYDSHWYYLYISTPNYILNLDMSRQNNINTNVEDVNWMIRNKFKIDPKDKYIAVNLFACKYFTESMRNHQN